MPRRQVRLLGDPDLRIRATTVTNAASSAIRVVVDELREVLKAERRKHKLGRAIAAPQIGAPSGWCTPN
ncbi:MAG: hypothetical protein EXR93_04165 [Gemmatimonadetes bacterium]|nr:hypothetical protein [Gemmatimonadota bacterium]